MSTQDIFITGMARTPMGGFQGELSSVTGPHLGAAAIRAAVARAGITADAVDEVRPSSCDGSYLSFRFELHTFCGHHRFTLWQPSRHHAGPTGLPRQRRERLLALVVVRCR